MNWTNTVTDVRQDQAGVKEHKSLNHNLKILALQDL